MHNRKPFWKQIIIFNLPAFIAAITIILCCLLILFVFKIPFIPTYIPVLILIGTAWLSISSVLFSYFIYDRSGLYRFDWLKPHLNKGQTLFNVYSGYSEGGHILNERLENNNILHLDFFDKKVSVTGSIKKAQSLSLPLNSINISANDLHTSQKAAVILFMQSLHELREKELKSVMLRSAAAQLEPQGKIIIAEHLFELKNFLIYGPGAFHFFGKDHWKEVIQHANLKIENSFSITPFVKIFIITK